MALPTFSAFLIFDINRTNRSNWIQVNGEPSVTRKIHKTRIQYWSNKTDWLESLSLFFALLFILLLQWQRRTNPTKRNSTEPNGNGTRFISERAGFEPSLSQFVSPSIKLDAVGNVKDTCEHRKLWLTVSIWRENIPSWAINWQTWRGYKLRENLLMGWGQKPLATVSH